MKTNKIKIFFSIISFCFLVTSCNNLLSELTQQKTYIQISTNLDNTNQRTVLPNFSVVKGQGYTWQLYNGDTLFQTWDDANGKSAYQNMCESKIEVDPGSYSFELKVIKDDKIILKSESQTVTIEQNKKIELNFVLCPPTDNEAYGSVNFKVTFPKEKVNIVEAYLFKPEDDKKAPVGNMQDVEISPEDSPSTANITVNNVPAGSYLLKVDLCYQVAAYSRIEKINTYTTIVQVAAGFCSEAEVTLNSLTDYYTITYKVDNDIITTFQGGDNQTTFKKNSEVDLLIACNSTNDQISIGWFKNKECTEPVELNSDNKFTITDNITLYSQWGSKVSDDVLKFGAIDTENNIEGLLIQNETGLNYFRNIVNGTLTENIIVSNNVAYRSGTPYPTVNAKLCDDIELTEDNWVPIGYYKNDNDNKAYNGIFDGNGKCVTNLKITPDSTTDTGIAFFGAIQDATIKNLYVSGEINGESLLSIGGIVGDAYGNSSIYNCVNNIQINNNNTSRSIGGILGWLDSNSIVQINSCVNIAPINNNYSVAGILGYGSSNVTIKNCLNLGKITNPSETFNVVAGIANIYGDTEKSSSVTSCINASSIQGKDEDDNIYPIVYIASSDSNATLSNNYYDSTILPTVTPVTNVQPKNSSELDGLPLDGWYNTVSDSQYPIPSTIQEAFENKSSCWDIILQDAKITEATPGYVEGAYFVNGETGDDDNNSGLSITSPKRNLTNVITSLKDSIDNPTRTIYIDGKLTAESQGVTTQKSGNEGALVYIMDGEGCQDDYKITIKGIKNALLDAKNFAKFFASNGDLYLRIEDVELINGKTTASGGAFFFYGSILELDNCKISNCSSIYATSPESYTGIYMCGTSVLNMTNTTCKNSIYLAKTTATIGSNCTIGTSDTTATDGFITLDESTLILDGEDIFIYKPIYINNLNARIELGDKFKQTDSKIQIKINPVLVGGFSLFDPLPENLLDLFELVESDGFTLGADGQIIKN